MSGAAVRFTTASASCVDGFRAAFRRLASGVCVVTLRRRGHLHGFTATSVTSVSAEPPMLLFCLSTASDSFPSLSRGTMIGVSMLSSRQRTVADRFAGKVPPGGYGDIETVVQEGEAPVLRGAIAQLSGKICQLIPVHNHVVVVCEVHAAQAAEEGRPLIYSDRTYQELAEPGP